MYTIFKVLIQNSIKSRYSDKGFTLLELIFGLLVMIIVGGLAMNALIDVSSGLNKDKRSIDSSQNLSAVLEIIGNDIRQSGEKINDSNFPTIEFKIDPASTSGSSKVIIRRSVANALTLCQGINTPASTPPAPPTIATTTTSTITTIFVAANDPTTIGLAGNCDVGTPTTQLFAARPQANYTLIPAMPLPPLPLGLILPDALRQARDYRCQLADPNPSMPYNSPSQPANAEFCTAAPQKVRIALSDQSGHILVFNQTNEIADPANTATARRYAIEVDSTFANPADPANASNALNITVSGGYRVGSPIYLIEERTYTLDNSGNFQLSVNGGAPTTLLTKIANFRVSARGYTDATNKIVNPTPPVAAADLCPNAPPFDNLATAPTVDDPQYICRLNFNSTVTFTPMNWKMIAGVKVELQSKYNAAGQASETSTNSGDIAQVATAKKKLYAKAEFFPRNVLSK